MIGHDDKDDHGEEEGEGDGDVSCCEGDQGREGAEGDKGCRGGSIGRARACILQNGTAVKLLP